MSHSFPRLCVLLPSVLIGCSAHPVDRPVAPRPLSAVSAGNYAGSTACQPCHADIYARWKGTRMANVVRDPAVHPDAILPDFSRPDPLLTFTKADIAFVYGSKWKQRYFQKVGDDYFPLPAQWDVTHAVWKPYHVADGTDWWVPAYPKENAARPTGPLCDGCHSVDYDVVTKKVGEWNVGCEKCHGRGANHVARPTRENILNPAHMDPFASDDVCVQCHSQGRPLSNPIAGRTYDWPVGYEVGKRLQDFWQLEDHKLGEKTFTHFEDGTAHKNRMQGNDFAQSLMFARGVTCASCHDVHGTKNDADLIAPKEQLCLRCHTAGGANGPRAATLEAHTHHKSGSPGNECVECHMPKIAQTIGDVNVRSHTFRFVFPSATAASGMPNACTQCHKDKTADWATGAMKTWASVSPWRVGR